MEQKGERKRVDRKKGREKREISSAVLGRHKVYAGVKEME